jgi:hypothetical protein
MAGRPRKPRKDSGTKRGSYNVKVDTTGKTVKENAALKSFWSNHKMEDIIQLSTKELDKVISKWIENFQDSQLKRNKSWWYPTIHYDPNPKVKGPKKINTSFNSSFRRD